MQEARIQEGGEDAEDFGGFGPGRQVPVYDHPSHGGREGDAEGLMPPAAPEAGESTVEDGRERSEYGRVLPGFPPDGIKIASDEVLQDIEIAHHQQNDLIYGDEEQDASAEIEEGQGNWPQQGRRR